MIPALVKVVVGLGNPGAPYATTRHNVGFLVVDALARACRVAVDRPWREPGATTPVARYAEGTLGGQPVRLVKPMTMMNASGRAVRTLDVVPETLLVVCDDANLPLGAVRLRPHGSAGGHRGLASCLEAMGTEAVPRLRIGVGVARMPKELDAFVLSPFDAEEREPLEAVLARAAQAAEAWVADGIAIAMNRYNTKGPQHA